MKEVWSKIGNLFLCILKDMIAIAVLALIMFGPIVSTTVTDNPWWLLLYIPELGVLFGIIDWKDGK